MPESDIKEDNDIPSNLLVEAQRLTTKYSINPYSKNESVVYEFTQDPALLLQYYCLRQTRYDRVFKVAGYNWGEDYYDKLSHILIARRGNLCIGGCRLVIREGDEAWSLPMEIDGFSLRESLPDLPLNKVRHAELSRLTILDDCGDDNILTGLYKAMYDRIINSDIHYLFVVSVYHMARNWRLVANNFGVKTTRIVEDMYLTDSALDPSIKWYLTMSDLTQFPGNNHINKNIAKLNNDKILENLH